MVDKTEIIAEVDAVRKRRSLQFKSADIDKQAAVAVAVFGPRNAALVGAGGTAVGAGVDRRVVGAQGVRQGRPAVADWPVS